MGLPTGTTHNDIALGETGHVRGNHLADRATLHHIAYSNRLGVGRRIAHPAAHIGVERKPQRAQQHLAWSRLWDGKFFQAKIIQRRFPNRPRGKNDPFSGFGHCDFLRVPMSRRGVRMLVGTLKGLAASGCRRRG